MPDTNASRSTAQDATTDQITTRDCGPCDTMRTCTDDVCGFDSCGTCAWVKVYQDCPDTSCLGDCVIIDHSCCGSYGCN